MEGFYERPEQPREEPREQQASAEIAAFATGPEDTTIVPESGSALDAQPDGWTPGRSEEGDPYAATDNDQVRQAFMDGMEEATGEGNGWHPDVFDQTPTYAQIQGELDQEFRDGDGIPTTVVERARSMGAMRVAALRMGIELPPADAPDTDYNRALRTAHGLPVPPRTPESGTTEA